RVKDDPARHLPVQRLLDDLQRRQLDLQTPRARDTEDQRAVVATLAGQLGARSHHDGRRAILRFHEESPDPVLMARMRTKRMRELSTSRIAPHGLLGLRNTARASGASTWRRSRYPEYSSICSQHTKRDTR